MPESNLLALTREPSPALGSCELTHLERQPIDLERARVQHRAYESLLAELGCELLRLPAESELPDSVFVEDVAVVLDELAVITRPGAPSRRPEAESVARALAPHRKLATLREPGRLDGGDLLAVGRTLYAGLSSRTDRAGVEQLRALVEPLGYEVVSLAVRGCLHLKSAASRVGAETLLVQPRWVDPGAFGRLEILRVDPAEPFAANALAVGGTLVYPAAFPRTRERLEARDIPVRTVDLSELAKAEGGVTCCSLIFERKKE